MTENNWQILYIDDDLDILQQIKSLLDGEELHEGRIVVTTSGFDSLQLLLEAHRYDVVILDLRVGSQKAISSADEAGLKTLSDIQSRQFIPVVFYTALPSLVSHLQSPLVKVVEKTTATSSLLQTLKDVFDTSLPTINRALIRHMESVQKDYMWGFVASNWEHLNTTGDHSALAYLLARRLAISLSEKGIEALISSIGGKAAPPKEGVHPMQYYVIPPVEQDSLAGDVFLGNIDGKDAYWVLLTPSCDLVAGRDNAEFALFAKCSLLIEHEEYKRWKGNPEKYKESFEKFVGNRKKDRYYYLPAALFLPDLVIDLQSLATIPFEKLVTLKRLASLDSPYAEALLTRFSRYFGRIGVPDLDATVAISRLSELS